MCGVGVLYADKKKWISKRRAETPSFHAPTLLHHPNHTTTAGWDYLFITKDQILTSLAVPELKIVKPTVSTVKVWRGGRGMLYHKLRINKKRGKAMQVLKEYFNMLRRGKRRGSLIHCQPACTQQQPIRDIGRHKWLALLKYNTVLTTGYNRTHSTTQT